MSAATLVTGSAGSLTRHLANMLTALRLALAAPIGLLLLAGSRAELLLAAVLFGTAALTDLLDGRVARGQGRVSAVGCFLDPLADKCVIDTCIVALVLLGAFPLALALLFIGRDLTITLLRLRRRTPPALLAPGRMAKLKTGALYAGIGGLVVGRLSSGPILFASWLLVGSAAVLSVLSATRYVRDALAAAPADRAVL